MKKFKTTREKHIANEKELAHLLGERDLLKTVFLDFTHLPSALFIALAMMALSYFNTEPASFIVHMQFLYLGLGCMGFYSIYQTWHAFDEQRIALKNTRNHFVGQKRYPILFGLISLYLLLPLEWPVLLAGSLTLFLALLNPRLPFTKNKHSHIGTIVAAMTLSLPLLATPQLPSPLQWGIWGASLLLIFLMNFWAPKED